MKDQVSFYLSKEEPNKSCLLALRDIILKSDVRISETTKYGMPCFTIKNKAICYLWIDKKTLEPYILFVEGQLLQFPELETGNRARMKIMRINPLHDIPFERIKLILCYAIQIMAQRG